MTTRTVARRARKHHPACGGYCPAIQPGEVYLLHTEMPGADAEYANSAGHPVRMAECGTCARRYGRGHLLDTKAHPCGACNAPTLAPGICHQCNAPGTPAPRGHVPPDARGQVPA